MDLIRTNSKFDVAVAADLDDAVDEADAADGVITQTLHSARTSQCYTLFFTGLSHLFNVDILTVSNFT